MFVMVLIPLNVSASFFFMFFVAYGSIMVSGAMYVYMDGDECMVHGLMVHASLSHSVCNVYDDDVLGTVSNEKDPFPAPHIKEDIGPPKKCKQ